MSSELREAIVPDSLLDSLEQRSSLTSLRRASFSEAYVDNSSGYVADQPDPGGEPFHVIGSTGFSREKACKYYELKNHLGNVLVTVSDLKLGQDTVGATDTANYYFASVLSAQDYYPFGWVMPERKWNNPSYRYGFNGMEKDDEISGNGNSFTAMFWQYDGRIGRRWNPDPIAKEYESIYSTFANNPIWIVDPSGADSIFYDQTGKEIEGRRVKMEGLHTYWLSHEDGNVNIGGKTYYQGNSYYSFFGDPDKFTKPTLFTSIDETTIPDLSAETLDNLTSRYNGESFLKFWKPHSGAKQKFDYKNSSIMNENAGSSVAASNLTTAYMINGVLYNRNETGMFLWGATAAKTNTTYRQLATWNLHIHHYIEGNSDEFQEVRTWSTGFWTIRLGNSSEIARHVEGSLKVHFQNVQGVDPPHGLKYPWKGETGNQTKSSFIERVGKFFTMGVLYSSEVFSNITK